MTTTVNNRITFARGLAHLLLAHVESLEVVTRAYIQSLANAATIEQMRDVYYAYPAVAGVDRASAAASYVSAYAAYAYGHASFHFVERACEHAIKAGVPEDAVHALRGLLVTQ